MADTKISAATAVSGAGAVSMPVHRAGSTAALRLQCNLEATTDPGVGDDSADGYSIGSTWLNKSTGAWFIAVDVSSGAAIWQRQSIGFPPVWFDLASSIYATNPAGVGYGAAAQAADTLYLIPIFLPVARTITKIAIIRGSAVVGNGRLGLYKMLASGQPGTLIVDGGTVDTNGTGVVEATVSVALPSGWLWGACVFNAAANVQRGSSHSTSVMGVANAGTGHGVLAGATRSFTYGTLPADESAQSYTRSGAPTWMGIR